jgi:hypothetical protein
MDENNSHTNFIINRSISKVGFWSGIAAFIAITTFGIVQALQISGFFTYSVDVILIYGLSLCITIPFML